MKSIRVTCFLALFCCTMACANNDKQDANDTTVKAGEVAANVPVNDTFEAGKVISPVFCKADAAQSYALYIPASGNNKTLPVVYFFDPHGNGSLPLAKYKALADLYNFILIGSNNSKNGNDWATTENTWNNLFNDSQKRLKINVNRIYTCGFSGGARVASYVGINHNEVKAVIANGAGLPDASPPGNFHFSFTAIAGEGDMNMTELVSTIAALDKTATRHRIIFFDGKHEWAPENTMNIAFTCLQLDAMHEKLVPADDAYISNYVVNSKKRIDAWLQAGNYIKSEEECKLSISLLDGLTDHVNWFKEKEGSLKSDPVYQRQSQSRQNLLATEQNLKEVYGQQFQQGDMSYWVKVISELQTKSKAFTAEGAMYQRLLAWLSLAFYSISNQLVSGHQDKEARYFVDLYKMVDAANSEAWYFSAIVNARSNNFKAAENDLLKAIDNGFTDKNRIMQQPEFQNSQINLAGIGNKIKKAE